MERYGWHIKAKYLDTPDLIKKLFFVNRTRTSKYQSIFKNEFLSYVHYYDNIVTINGSDVVVPNIFDCNELPENKDQKLIDLINAFRNSNRHKKLISSSLINLIQSAEFFYESEGIKLNALLTSSKTLEDIQVEDIQVEEKEYLKNYCIYINNSLKNNEIISFPDEYVGVVSINVNRYGMALLNPKMLLFLEYNPKKYEVSEFDFFNFIEI